MIHESPPFESSAQRGWTALHLAVHEGNLEVVKMLIEEGANKNAELKNGPAGLQAGFHALWGLLQARSCCSDP